MSDIENEDQHAADEPQPGHEPEHVLPDDSDSDVLSDLDDEFYDDYNTTHSQVKEPIPIDEDTIPTLGKYKKKAQAGAEEPPRDKKRRRRGKSLKDDDEDEAAPIVEVELTAEEKRRRELDRKMDEALKAPKKHKRRKNDHDLERMDDEMVENLRLAMLEAAKADTEAVDNGQPATHKLGMVDEVRDLLNRQNLLSVAVDCGILKGIRRWLEPLPNKALPAYGVQKLMFEVLAKLKPEFIHLHESGIGKIVMFYTKDSRPERHIKREAEKLVREWSRPILGRSDDYRSKEIPTVGDGSRAGYANRARRPSDGPSTNPLALPQKDTGRARAMVAASQSYDVAPKSRLSSNTQFARPISAQGDDFIRKMKAKKAKGTRNQI